MTTLNYLSTLVLAGIALIAIAKDWKDFGQVTRWFLLTLTIASAILSLALTHATQKAADAESRQRAQAGVIAPAPAAASTTTEFKFPRLEIGTSGSILEYRGPVEKPIFRIFEEDHIAIVRESGEVKVSALIRDRNGRIVAELIKNEWRVNPSRAWDRNYNGDSLEVKDDQGDIVLQVQALPDRVQFQAKLYDAQGNGVAFGNSPDPAHPGGIMERTTPDHQVLTLVIPPRFKYPSELHLGQLSQK